TDLIVFGADNLDLSLRGAHEQDFVQYHGIDQYKQNAVENLFPVGEHHLQKQDCHVEDVQHDRDREPEFFMEYKRRNIHTSGGGSGTDHDPDGKADHQSAAHGRKHRIIGKITE